MNLYYLWQEDVPDLSDSRFDNQQDLNGFLSDYSNPIDLFQHLRTDPTVDRFSAIFSDYTVLEGVLTGTAKNNGVDFALRYKQGSATDLFGYVRYILPGSDAATKDIARGDIFYAVNGTPLTVDNYQSLLSPDSYTLNMADYDNGNITPNGQSVTLTKTPYAENPIYKTAVIETAGHTVGYLMYNGFYAAYDGQLNAAFGQFAAAGVTDFVLDLRYNSGGSVQTATYLASMITGQFNGQVFASERWNDKAQAYYESQNPAALVNKFTNTLSDGAAINHLNLGRVFILTSRSTASASELVINGLAPYLGVVQIGDNTTGKNVGSVTLYDSENFGPEGRNPTHRYAMQPIVLKVVNSEGFGEYQQNGLAPDYELQEDLANMGVIGDPSEPMLATAVSQITGTGRRYRSPERGSRHFADLKSLNGLQNQMYIDKLPDNLVDKLR
jgi:C-terminal processing protease CtpA/Prc